MFESNSQTSRSGVYRVKRARRGRVKGEAAAPFPAIRNALLGQLTQVEALNIPTGVKGIAITFFIAGSALLVATLVLIYNLTFNPRTFVHTFIWAGTCGSALVLLAVALLFIRTGRGLWQLRRSGLRLAFISSTIASIWFLFVLVQGIASNPSNLLTGYGLVSLLTTLVGPAIMYYLAQKRIRTQFT